MSKWQSGLQWEALPLKLFRLLLSSCLNWKIYCDYHSSLSSTTAVQKWIISYTSQSFRSNHVFYSLFEFNEILQFRVIHAYVWSRRRWRRCSENLRIYLVLHDCHSVPVAKLLHWVQRLHVFQHLPVKQNIAFILQWIKSIHPSIKSLF